MRLFFSVFLINSFLAIFLGMLVLELTEQILEYLFGTFFFAIISTLLTYYSAKKPSSLMLKRLSIITLEVAIFLNFGNLVTFWTTFAPFYFCCIENYWIVALSWSHIVPQFLLLANLFLSDARILRKDVMWGSGTVIFVFFALFAVVALFAPLALLPCLLLHVHDRLLLLHVLLKMQQYICTCMLLLT